MDVESESYFSSNLVGYLIAWAVALTLSILICKTSHYHSRLTSDTTEGIQKFHIGNIPRIGGLAVYVTLWVISFTVTNNDINEILRPLLYAVVPAFMSGLIEDITARINPGIRLLAVMSSGLLICLMTGISIKSLNVIGLDQLIAIPAISIVITAFMLAGVANAMNIIDGFNGLSTGSATIFFITFSVIAFSVNDAVLGVLCLLLAASVLGFWCVNYPFGKLFLGDGGAYLIGFILAWIAVLLPYRNGLSSWVSLLVCSYPVIEVLCSIVRRKINGHNPSQPDCWHLHSLVKLVLVRSYFYHKPAWWRNSVVFVLLLPYILLSQCLALAFFNQRNEIILAFIICALLYLWIYQYLIAKLHVLKDCQ